MSWSEVRQPRGAEGLRSRHAVLNGPVLVREGWLLEVEVLLQRLSGTNVQITLIGERDGGLWVTWTGEDAEATAILEAAVLSSRGWPR